MTSRAARREIARIEAIASAVFGLILIIALAGGGIGGFGQVLASLVFLGVVVSVVAGACFLVMRSRLILPKRTGISLIIVSGFTGWL